MVVNKGQVPGSVGQQLGFGFLDGSSSGGEGSLANEKDNHQNQANSCSSSDSGSSQDGEKLDLREAEDDEAANENEEADERAASPEK